MLVLPAHIGYQSWKRLGQATIADYLGVSQSAISHAMRELVEHGFVERRGKGPVIEWRLMEEFGWRGTVDEFHAHKRARARQAAMTAVE